MKSFLTFAALCAVLFSACSPFNLITSTTYNDTNLAKYSTFRIVTPEEGKLPPGMDMVTYYNIAAAIREQMVIRGYTENQASPMLINIGLTVKQQIATEPAYQALAPYQYTWGPYYGGCAPWFMYPRAYYWPPYYNSNAQVITGIYNEGVLTMDIVNIVEKLPLFSASVGTIVDDNNSQFRNLQGINEAVQTLFSKFPVAVLPQYRK